MTEVLSVKKNKKTLLFARLAENHFIYVDNDLKIIHFVYDEVTNKISLLKGNEIPMLKMIQKKSALTINLIQNQGVWFLSVNHMIFSFNLQKINFSLFKILKENVM